jgi:transcriptional regulator with XRE-family HTH domain
LPTKITFNLFDVIKRLERHKGETVTNTYVAERSGLSRFTIQKIVNNDSERVDLSTLAALLDFFHAEGMPVTVADLFSVTTDKEPSK